MKLFEEYVLNKGLVLKNRIVMAPMCMYSSNPDGFVGHFHLTHYTSRAYGGVALIIQEATAVETRGRISDGDLGIWSDQHVEGLKTLVESVQFGGAKMGIQLAHAGRKCKVDGEEVIGPSPIAFNQDYKSPKEMSKKDIKEVIKAYKEAARRSKEANYDLIEIHGAHGYLVNEFLSPLSNKRTDEYGGSLENRVRFLKEIITAIKKEWDGPLGVRLSAEEFAEGGNHIEDYQKIVDLIKDELDFVNVSSGGVVPVTDYKPYPGYQISFASKIKQSGITTIGGGLITTYEQINEILESNQADLVYLGRELLRNPNFVLSLAKLAKREDLIIEQYERGFK
jgi:NADPH2 dehydrogenase